MMEQVVKTDFDFVWKREIHPDVAELALRFNRGDILDVGCGTCQLFNYLKKKGWKGKYIGIDVKKYEGYEYSTDVNLIIGDAFTLEFPKTDTCILYDVLEHVDDPVRLLSKSLKVSKNALVTVPKRNEEMWKYGITEFHQLDKTHKHCGFTKEEVIKVVKGAGGKIIKYKELIKTDATIGKALWKNKIPKLVVLMLGKLFTSKAFYQEIWCEVERVE